MSKIVLVGIGDTGIKFNDRLKRLNIPDFYHICISTDEIILDNITADEKHFLSIPGLDRIKAFDVYNEMNEVYLDIEGTLAQARLVLVLSAFGGQTGTWGTVSLVESIKRKLKVPVISVVFLPFRVERIARMIAYFGLSKLSKLSSTIIPIDLERMLLLMPEEDIEDVFAWIDEKLMNIIIDLLKILKKTKAAPVSIEKILSSKYLTIGFLQMEEYTEDELVYHIGKLKDQFLFQIPGDIKFSEMFASIIRSPRLLDNEYDNIINILRHEMPVHDLHLYSKVDKSITTDVEITLLSVIPETIFTDLLIKFEQEAIDYFKEMNISILDFGITEELLKKS